MPLELTGNLPSLRPRLGPALLLASALQLACLGGCALHPPGESGVVVNKASASAIVASEYLQLMQKLIQGSASDKAEIFAAAQHDYELAATPTHGLRLALVLSTPGHPAWDPVRAQQLLREILANPEALVQSEKALAYVELKQIDDYLTLQSENKRLAGEAAKVEHLTSQIRSLKSEADEAAQLRKDLAEARHKLEVITTIETHLNDRSISEHSLAERKLPSRPNTEGQPH